MRITRLTQNRTGAKASNADFKTAEEAIREQEDHFKALVENSLQPLAILTSAGAIRYQSPSFENILGYKSGHKIDSRHFGRIHRDDVSKLAETLPRLLHNEGERLHTEVRVQKEDSSWRWIEIIGTNCLDNPLADGIFVYLHDITARKNAQEQLQVAQDKFETLFENSAVAVMVTDENEKIISWNKFTETLLGMDRDDLNMKPVSSLYPGEEWKMIRAQNIRQKGMQHHLETRVIRKNHEILDVDLSVSVLKGPDGKVTGSIGIIANITERKNVQKQLQAAQEKFETLFENTAVAIMVTDENEHIISWNSFTETLLGMDRDDLHMKPVSSLYPGEEWKMIRAQNIRQKGMQHHLETRVIKKNNEIIDVDLSVSVLKGTDGKVSGSIGIMADITDRKNAQDQLQVAEEKFETLFENTAVAVMVTDENENIIFWNSFTETLLDMDKDALYMKPVSSLYPEEEWKMIRAQNIRQKGMHNHLETKIIKKNHEIINVDLSVSVLKGPGGKVTGSIGVIADITERNRADEERQKMEQQLQLAGRLAAVGELAAGVAHELNNPLAAVQAYAQFLASREDLNVSMKNDVETIYKEAQRATRITTNLLSFARRHTPEKRLVSINEAIEKSLELHSYRMRVNNIEVVAELSPDLPTTIGDFHQLQQIFVNIINNAEQAMTEAHGKGRLYVTTREVGEMIQITFSDDGPGISDEYMNRIFDPFFTTKEEGKGTGLGLGICLKIAKEHGGNLHASSEPGNGATFVVEIPIVSGDQPASEYTNITQPQSA